MARMFKIVLLPVFVAVVTAKYEYTEKNALNALQEYRSLVDKKAASLDYKFLNSDIAVHMVNKGNGRLILSELWLMKIPTEALNGGKPVKTSLKSDANEILQFDVHKQPGIKASLTSVSKRPLKQWIDNDSPQGALYIDFNLHEMDFHNILNGDDQYLTLALKFENSQSKQILEVAVQLFTDENANDHARKHQVPRIDSPVIISKISDGNPGSTDTKSVASAAVGISWMKEVLNRAKFVDLKDDKSSGKHVYYFNAGPAIIEKDSIDLIYSLFNKNGHEMKTEDLIDILNES